MTPSPLHAAPVADTPVSALPRIFLLSLLALFPLFLTACSAYQIEGVVVAGPVGGLDWVDSDDRRIKEPVNTVPDALIDITVDPEGMHPTQLAPVYTDQNGHFVVPMDKLGSDFMDYELFIVVRAEGYESTISKQAMPVFRGSKAILVTIMPGADHYIKPTTKDPTLEFKDRIYDTK